jgi:hypothetical protein
MPCLQVGPKAEERPGELSGLQAVRRTHMLYLRQSVLRRVREDGVQHVYSRSGRGGGSLVLGLLCSETQFLKARQCTLIFAFSSIPFGISVYYWMGRARCHRPCCGEERAEHIPAQETCSLSILGSHRRCNEDCWPSFHDLTSEAEHNSRERVRRDWELEDAQSRNRNRERIHQLATMPFTTSCTFST